MPRMTPSEAFVETLVARVFRRSAPAAGPDQGA